MLVKENISNAIKYLLLSVLVFIDVVGLTRDDNFKTSCCVLYNQLITKHC